MNSFRIPKSYPILRTVTVLALVILSMPSLATLSAHGQSYNLKYELSFVGVPFAGGAISLISNFTNNGQLRLRVTTISFVSDFWSNGTRQVTSGFPFNLTTGMNKMVDTTVLIPTSVSIGNHDITATATWQYSNSSGWYTASPVVTSPLTVTVSQAIGSLLSSLATILVIGLGVALVAIVLVVFLVLRQRKKPKPGVPSPASPQPSLKTMTYALSFFDVLKHIGRSETEAYFFRKTH